MRRTTLALIAGVAAVAIAPRGAAAEPQRVRLDTEATIGGVAVACTGIGQTKDQPRWQAYPVRVEFANARRDYLAGELVTLSQGKAPPILEVACEGPWVLFKLPPGKPYQVTATLTEYKASEPRTATVKAPRRGQARFVITFPEAN